MKMRLGITAKLFLAILLTCVIASLAILGAMRYSFQRGFLGYLNEQEAQRVESVLPNLAEAYRQNGSWEFLRDHPRRWFSLIRPEGMHRMSGDQTQPSPQHDRVDQQADERPKGWRRMGMGRRAHERPFHMPESELTGIMMRFSLLDVDKRLVIGNPKHIDQALTKPIMVDGVIVGWVAWLPLERAITDVAQRFHKQQTSTGWFILIIAILLASIVSWLLAKIFLAPLKHITASTHSLAAGDYATRVKVSSHDEMGQLAEDFNKLAVTLEKNERLRRDFMADISHELRTPLAVLKGELEAVEDGVRPMSIKTIQSLQSEVGTLNKLVDDLYQLSLSDVGALVYRKQRIDVQEILSQAVDAFQERFAEKKMTVSFTENPALQAECNADPLRLQQMFANLLENSARYTDEGGRLVITMATQGKGLQINFQDSAPGVALEKMPHLFERFYRAEHSRNRATGGSGLGLAISRNIVEAHGGSMSAHASPMGGLWVSVSLPLYARESV